jgi:3-hydroxyisobutyrate dehydrogenase-like beta-hydroxyacid dehydrogenase
MGRPIAEYLVDAGIEVTVYDLSPDAVAAMAARGAKAATSLLEAAEQSDVIIVIVPSDDDVRSVCMGEDGLLAGARPSATLVISSSVRPETCRSIADQAQERGVNVLDAALTGGVRGAEAGRINLLVGGDPAVLERIRPVLEPWTVAVHHLGDLGAGQVGKTVNNLCHWSQIAGINEALTLGRRLGVPPGKLRSALLDGPAASRTLAEMDQMRLTWWKKDIANAELMAADVGMDLPIAERVRDLMPGITVDRIAELVADRDLDAPAADAPEAG